MGESRSNFKFVSLIGLGLAFVLISQQMENRPQTTQRILVNSEVIPHVVLGFKMLAADILWVRLNQEIDYSENKGHEINKGWAFHMLDSITTLDPRYWIAYRAGVTVLSVLVRDTEGARILYERGIKEYPRDWPLLYRAGYHFLSEVKDCKRAAEVLKQAADAGGPTWINSLVSRIYEKSGQYDLAHSVLLDSLEKFKDTPLEETLKNRLTELESKKSDFQLIPCN